MSGEVWHEVKASPPVYIQGLLPGMDLLVFLPAWSGTKISFAKFTSVCLFSWRKNKLWMGPGADSRVKRSWGSFPERTLDGLLSSSFSLVDHPVGFLPSTGLVLFLWASKLPSAWPVATPEDHQTLLCGYTRSHLPQILYYTPRMIFLRRLCSGLDHWILIVPPNI